MLCIFENIFPKVAKIKVIKKDVKIKKSEAKSGLNQKMTIMSYVRYGKHSQWPTRWGCGCGCICRR